MLKFRKINSNELNLIKTRLINAFNFRDFDTFKAPYEIILAIGKWKEVLLISDQMMRIFQELKEYRNPYFMGTYFGDISKKRFRISLEGVTLLSDFMEEKTVLTDSGEQSVLYERDLTVEDVMSIPPNIQNNNLSILVNKNKEVVALGRYLFDREEIMTFNRERKIIKNVIDKGWYLRKGK